MQYAVKDLEGALLDAAVAKAEGLSTEIVEGVCFVVRPMQRWHMNGAEKIPAGVTEQATPFRPSTDGRDGMPFIERERIMLISAGPDEWNARIGEVLHAMSGDPIPDGSGRSGCGWGETALIAAMRAFCASRFGETVELP